MAKKKVRHILHPIYWPNWVGIGFMRLVTFLPFGWQLKLGAALGHIAYRFASDRKHITRTNLSLCFPEQTEAQREALLKGILINSAIGLLETNYAWNGAINKIAKRYHYSGLEYLQGAKDQNQPVLLLGMHFSTLDLCGAALATHIPFHVMYRRNKNPVLEKVMSEGRERNFPAAIERSNVRDVIRALKDKKIVWYGPDQDYGAKQSVFAPFFGVPAASITATARIAKMTGAKVIPFYHRRDENNHYFITLGEPLKDFPSGDEVHDATRVNQIVEQAISEAPEQYWWVHRRFKTRPPGQSRPY